MKAPTADVWVSRRQDGTLEAIPVHQMSPDHVRRWIFYFRQKVRAIYDPELTDKEADEAICEWIITARSIFEHAKGLGIYASMTRVAEPKKAPLKSAEFSAENQKPDKAKVPRANIKTGQEKPRASGAHMVGMGVRQIRWDD